MGESVGVWDEEVTAMGQAVSVYPKQELCLGSLRQARFFSGRVAPCQIA